MTEDRILTSAGRGPRHAVQAGHPQLSRKQFLGLGGLTAATMLVGGGVAAGTASTAQAAAGSGYGPVRYTSESVGRAALGIPSDARLVYWPYNSPRSAYIQEAVAKLGSNDILVLPEADQSYYIDSSKGFVSNDYQWNELVRVKRGLVGAGPGAVVEIGPSSFSRPKQLKKDGGANERAMGCATTNGIFANFEMRGRDLGGIAYHGLAFTKSGGKIVQVYANAAHRGFRNSPGGETSAFLFLHVDKATILRSEVECRDSTGKRVASSPIMMGWCNNLLVQDCYFHHAVGGMPSMFGSSSGQFTRVRSEYNGSGGSGGVASYDPTEGWGLSGSCFNFEYCTGTFHLDDCTFICNYLNRTDPKQPVGYDQGNVGGHVGGGSATDSLKLYIANPKFDGGAHPGNFDFQIQRTYAGATQHMLTSDLHVTDSAGKAVPFVVRN